MKKIIGNASSPRVSDYWKVPFREVYAANLLQWFKACAACLLVTAGAKP